jgi:hypothetical protein
MQTPYNMICYSGKPRLRTAVEMLRTTQDIEKQLQEVKRMRKLGRIKAESE